MSRVTATVSRGTIQGELVQGTERYSSGEDDLLLKTIGHPPTCMMHYLNWGKSSATRASGQSKISEIWYRWDYLPVARLLHGVFSSVYIPSSPESCGLHHLCSDGPQDIPIREIQLLNRGNFATHYLISYRFVLRIPAGNRDTGRPCRAAAADGRWCNFEHSGMTLKKH
jgi:hypothetical protein